MKMIIFGSTGKTGQQVVKQALQEGHDVTAFARSPEKLGQPRENLKIVTGDVLDAASVTRAVQGQDVVLCSLGLPAITDKSNLRANGTKNILRAMEKTGVRRFICQSSHGVGNSRCALPFLYKYIIVPFMLRRVFADHEIQEAHVRESRLDWTIVRPVALTDGERTNAYRHGFAHDDTSVTFKISRADVADFMLKQTADHTYLHRTPAISL